MRRSALLGVIALGAACAVHSLGAQADTGKSAKRAPKPPKAPGSDSVKSVPPLFRSASPLAITFTANMKVLRRDKSQTSPERAATFSYISDSGKTVTVPLKVRTHGIWRLAHCELPPLRPNFANSQVKGTLFHDLNKPKMVSACKDDNGYEAYVLREFQLYRIYQLLTPASHRARLLRVSYADSATGKVLQTRYAFLFEDPDEMAARLNAKIAKLKGGGPDDLDPTAANIAHLFEYMIGNTDFSFGALHNAELVMKHDASTIIPVAYDFDFSGAVHAVYATVDPSLQIKRVIDRQYRGYCAHRPQMAAVIDLFKQKRSAIMALYEDEIGKLMDKKSADEQMKYWDEFYESISTPKAVERNVMSTCTVHN